MMFITPILVTATIFVLFLSLEGELDVTTVFTGALDLAGLYLLAALYLLASCIY
jgi:hypothetical protein